MKRSPTWPRNTGPGHCVVEGPHLLLHARGDLDDRFRCVQRDLVLGAAWRWGKRRVVGLEVGRRSSGEVDLGAGDCGVVCHWSRVAAAVTLDGDLEHHAGRLVACDGAPRLGGPLDDPEAGLDRVARGRSAGVPVSPPSLRSWGIVPALVTRTHHLGPCWHLDRRRRDVELSDLDVEHLRCRGAPRSVAAFVDRPKSPVLSPRRWRPGRPQRSRR